MGFPAPLTGDFAAFGEGLVFGAEVATEDINNLGGIYMAEYGQKLPVELVVVDEESNVMKVRTLTEALITRDNVHALQTPDGPAQIQAPECKVAERHQIPNVIGGVPMETWLALRQSVDPPWECSWDCGFALATPTPPGDYRYGVKGYILRDVIVDALLSIADQTNKKVGVFAVDDPDGRGWWNLMPPALEAGGYEIIGVDKGVGLFAAETTDYTSIIQEWKSNDVEVLVGNCRAHQFGTLWRQCHTMGFEPKVIEASEAGLFYESIIAWGGDLPNGILCELWWSPSFEGASGIGSTTPQSLFDRWCEETGRPLNPGIGHGYLPMQVLFDAFERAGTVEGPAVNKALAETDLMTINYRVQFDSETHTSPIPLFLGQWQKTDKPWVWKNEIVYSDHDFLKPTAELLFPIPYD